MPDEVAAAGAPPVAPPMARPMPQVPRGTTAPATVAPEQAGRRPQAHIQATMGLNALERAAGLFGGSMSEEGREILQAVLKLRKKFGGAAPDLQRQELKMMGEQLPPVQTPNPQQGQAFQQAAKKMMATQGVPGAAA